MDDKASDSLVCCCFKKLKNHIKICRCKCIEVYVQELTTLCLLMGIAKGPHNTNLKFLKYVVII